ncbi:SBBP repeat-containing protein [Acidobacteriota bacterium]
MKTRMETKQRKGPKAAYLCAIVCLGLLMTASTSWGVAIWTTRTEGGRNYYDYAYDVCADAAGNAYAAGYLSPLGSSNYDMGTVKFNGVGTEVWKRTYNGPGNNYDYGQAVAVDSSGNVYTAGYGYGSGSEYYNYLTVKYNSSGTQQWAASYHGVSYDYGYDVDVDSSGNVYTTGYSSRSSGGYDACTVKYNSSGTQQWVQCYNGPGNSTDYGRKCMVDTAGNVIVSGYSYGSGSSYDFFAIKYNSSGVQQWVYRYNGPGNSTDYCYNMILDGSNNVYLTGMSYGSGTSYDYATVKLNSSGAQQWVARYHGGYSSDYGQAVDVNASGEVAVTGYSYGSGTSYDMTTIKYNGSGTQQWVNRFNGSRNSSDYGYGVGITSSGDVWAGGYAYMTNVYDYVVRRLSSSGTTISTDYYNGPGNSSDYLRAGWLQKTDNSFYVTGYSYGSGTYYDWCTQKFGTPSGNTPPVASSGGPYDEECNGQPTSTFQLDGSASYDLDGDKITYAWTTTCTSATFSDATAVRPMFTMPSPSGGSNCETNCSVTLTVTDTTNRTGSDTKSVRLADDTAPDLQNTPNSTVVECDAVPRPANVTIQEDCDPNATLTFTETRRNGPCQDTYDLDRTWVSMDFCGNSQSFTQIVTVQDTTCPDLIGVPGNVVVECDSVPAPAVVTTLDNCDPASFVTFNEVREDGNCPTEYTLYRTWTSHDRCGNECSKTQILTVVDTTPPELMETEDDLYCVWPPDHKIVCFEAADFLPEVIDNCSPTVEWWFDGISCLECPPDIPIESFARISRDGKRFCILVERLGQDDFGRHYALQLRAVDTCDNWNTAGQMMGYIWVPHDDSEHPECLHTPHVAVNDWPFR